jgi:hypothetical protein
MFNLYGQTFLLTHSKCHVIFNVVYASLYNLPNRNGKQNIWDKFYSCNLVVNYN